MVTSIEIGVNAGISRTVKDVRIVLSKKSTARGEIMLPEACPGTISSGGVGSKAHEVKQE
jgi:hypothetical protein